MQPVGIEFITKGEKQVDAAIKNLGRSIDNLTGKQVTASQAASRLEAQRKQETQTLERLRHKYIQGYAAMDAYSRELNDLAQAHRAGIISAQQQAAEVEKLNIALKNGSLVGKQTGRGMNQLGVLMQQTGYQVGDFAVQVQSGTHYMVALGQQATQLVGTFAMLAKSTRMIALFSGLGVIVPIVTAFAGAWMRASENMNEAADSASSLSSELENLDGKLRDWTRTREAASKGVTIEQAIAGAGVESAEEQLRKARENLERLRQEVEGEDRFTKTGVSLFLNYLGTRSADKDIAEAEEKVREAEKRLAEVSAMEREKARQDEIAYQDKIRMRMGEFIAERRAQEKAAADELSIYIQQSAEMFTAAQQRIREENGKTMRERIAAEEEYVNKIKMTMGEFIAERRKQEQAAKELTAEISASHKAYIPLGLAARNAKDATEKHVTEMANLFRNAQDLRAELGDAAYEALRLAGVDMTSGVDAAAKAAARLAANLGVSLQAALAIVNIKGGMKQQSGPRREGGRTLPQVTANIPGSLGEAYRRSLKIGEFAKGGGGAGRDPEEEFNRAKDAVDQLVASYDEQYAISLKVAEATKKIEEAQRLGAIPANMEADQILQDYIASLKDAENPMKKLADTARDALGDAFMSIVDGTKSAKDAFADMARIILKQAFELLVIKPILDGIFGGLTGGGGGGIFSLFSANGNAFSGGNVIPFANGGVVGGPTAFPMSGGRMGLMGEAGPEAIMPLKRGKGGKLGVVAEGGGGNVTVQNHFHIAANGDESVKRIIAQEAPKIANLTQKQVLEARSRGGAFRTTFGA